MPPEASQYRIHIACVPGGNVIANVSGSPAAFALSASGFTSFGVFTPACFQLVVQRDRLAVAIEQPGDDHRLHRRARPEPIVDANGMPISMCVAWFSPIDSLSRITAHDASFEMTESIPNCLK